jgi:nucleotide-binding universal stress UspA family protein
MNATVAPPDSSAAAVAPRAPTRVTTNPARRGPVVLATDGSSTRGATVVAAHLLATHLGLPLEIVTVVEPIPMYPYNRALVAGMYGPLAVEEMGNAQEAVVAEHVRKYTGANPARVHVRSGAPAHEIARFAREVSATLIVVGAAPHQRLRHTVSGERASRILRWADCPVLSVPPTFSTLPKTAVAAVDFGPSSVRAAEAALLVLEAGGTLVLTHVLPTLVSPAALSSPRPDDPATEVHALFDRLRAELAPHVPEGMRIETRLITGDAADGILSSVAHVNADLIAVGTHGPGLLERVFLGSVAESVMHAAEHTVLAVPPPPAAEALELQRRVSGAATSDEAGDWAATLDAFTRRNTGRSVMLEVADREHGTHVAGHGYALVGVTYEPTQRCIEIMVGDAQAPLRHLTRSVRDPDAITIARTPGDRGEMLDIRHGSGHTVVVVTEARGEDRE